jgi:hypothetical protein
MLRRIEQFRAIAIRTDTDTSKFVYSGYIFCQMGIEPAAITIKPASRGVFFSRSCQSGSVFEDDDDDENDSPLPYADSPQQTGC